MLVTGGELRSRALPTFTNILHTLAPPISSHERLQIHITHDLIGYPSLDPLIYQVFSRVMAQVEGGDLLVIQRGHESSPRRVSGSHIATTTTTTINHDPNNPNASNNGRRPSANTTTSGFISSVTGGPAGWSDGPWWRANAHRRSLGAVRGLPEGSKLARASAEAYVVEYFASRGGVEAAARRAAEVLSESNPTRSSDIFLAIQPIVREGGAGELFGGASASGSAKEEGRNDAKDALVAEPPEDPDDELCFALYLLDPIHSLAFRTVSQPIPAKWTAWLDHEPPSPSDQSLASPSQPTPGQSSSSPSSASSLPDDIRELVEAGGVDPREWVAEWVEEVLALGVGVVAQRYVARRMGVGEGGVGRGKGRAEVRAVGRGEAIEAGAGEAARAM